MNGTEQELDSFLLDLLVCPIDHQPLMYVPEHNVLYNNRLRKSYGIIDGIPVMLSEDASDVDDAHHKLYEESSTRLSGN